VPPAIMWEFYLTLAGGTASPLWQTLKKHGANLYLCGERDTIRCVQVDGILQIAHGAPIGQDTKLNYLVATVSSEGIELEAKEIAVTNEGGRPTIADSQKKQGFASAGKARLSTEGSKTVLQDATGCFAGAQGARP